MKSKKSNKKELSTLQIIVTIVVIIAMIIFPNNGTETNVKEPILYSYNIDEIPEYNGESFVYLNDNKPNFDPVDYNTTTFEYYSDFDDLGRCGYAYANVSLNTMPTSERTSIGSVKPSGWHTVKYDHIEGKYLYNRCHLIGFQLTAENANAKNLITCTRYANTKGMLPFENQVADYVRETGNHVLYRVTPIYDGDNLVASGIEMEAHSIEDDGKLEFHVYVYNIQDGVDIDYKTGESRLSR